MKGMIVNVVVGGGLFAGALVGGLAATGRLNHDGVANIPLLNKLFPAPPVDPSADPKADPNADPHAAPGAETHGKPADAHGDGAGGEPADASHHDAAPADEPAAEGAADGPQGQDPPGETKALKKGRSLFEPEAKGGGEHGGGGGRGEDKKEHGGGQEAKKEEHATTEHATPDHGAAGQAKHAAEHDFDQLGDELAQDRKSRYAPGGYFRFDGMPSGITPEKLNEAWRRVQEVMGDLEKRGQVLDLREKDLREFADDIARRQTEVGKERLEVENLQRQLDERIEQFQQQVKLVRTDEVAGLTRNAETLASFEPTKAVELITEQWKLESGQDEILKTLEFMEVDAVNAILAAMPNTLIREVLQKRLKVSKEPAAKPAGK